MPESYDDHLSIGIRPEGAAGLRRDLRTDDIVSHDVMMNRRDGSSRMNTHPDGRIAYVPVRATELIDDQVVNLDVPAEVEPAPGVNIVSPTVTNRPQKGYGYGWDGGNDVAPHMLIDGGDWHIDAAACVTIMTPPVRIVLPESLLLDTQELIISHERAMDDRVPGHLGRPAVASVKPPRRMEFCVHVRTDAAGLLWLTGAFENDPRFRPLGTYSNNFYHHVAPDNNRPHGGFCMGSAIDRGKAKMPRNCPYVFMTEAGPEDIVRFTNLTDPRNEGLKRIPVETHFGGEAPTVFGDAAGVAAALGGVAGGDSNSAVIVLTISASDDGGGLWDYQGKRLA